MNRELDAQEQYQSSFRTMKNCGNIMKDYKNGGSNITQNGQSFRDFLKDPEQNPFAAASDNFKNRKSLKDMKDSRISAKEALGNFNESFQGLIDEHTNAHKVRESMDNLRNNIADKSFYAREFGMAELGRNEWNNFKDSTKDSLNNFKDSLNNNIKNAKDNLKSINKDTVKNNLKNNKQAFKEGLKKRPEAWKAGGGKTLQLARATGVPGAESIQNAAQATKIVSGLATGAINPAAAATVAAKEFVKQLYKDPIGAMKTVLYACGCVCAPFFTMAAIPLFFMSVLIAMFFTMLSNDSSKGNAPIAAESWIYKYSEGDYQDVVGNKVDAAPSRSYVVSHNAAHQKSLLDGVSGDDDPNEVLLSEQGEEITQTEGYTDEVIYLYKEPYSSSEKFIGKIRYGDAVSAHIADGASEPSIVNGFLPIEIETSETGRTAGELYYEDKTGLENPNMGMVDKEIFYIKESLVYKREIHDADFEYTMEDEYEVMSMALRSTLQKKQQESLDEGNAIIDQEQAKYNPDFDDATLSESEKHQLVGAAIVREGDRIVPSLSSVTDPEAPTYDAEGSRAALASSATTNIGLSQDVATILSGYSVAKADSLPEKGYYKMLDETMKDYLKNSLSLSNGGTVSNTMSRTLSEKKVEQLETLSFNKNSVRYRGYLIEYRPEMEKYNPIRFSTYSSGSIMVDPESIHRGYDVSNYEGIYLQKDLRVANRAYMIENSTGYFALLSHSAFMRYISEYPNAPGANETYKDYNSEIAERKTLKVVGSDKQEVDYTYEEFRSALHVTGLNADEVVWEFFEQQDDDDTFYPMVKENNGAKSVDGEEVDIPSAPNWRQKLKLVRSLPFYQQQLSYIFDNSELEGKGYSKGANPLAGYSGENDEIYFQVTSGTPSTDMEKISFNEFKEVFGDSVSDNIETDGEYMLHWKKVVVEDYSTTYTTNSAGIEAEKRKFLWIIPLGYKQEYRRASEPETITKQRLDENGEYIKKYSKGGSSSFPGGFLPAGSVAVPLVDWQNGITSPYGNRWHPIHGVYRHHQGIDIARPTGTPLYAVFDGTVVYRESSNVGGGNMLWIQNSSGMVARYHHCHEMFFYTGDTVSAGQQIATVGNTGDSTGSHLHFEIAPNIAYTSHIDPYPWLLQLDTLSAGGTGSGVSGGIGGIAGEIEPEEPDTPEETDEETDEGEFDPEDMKFVTMSVGNKMDYWYDNIMQLFDSEESESESGHAGEKVAELAMKHLGDVGGVYFKNSYMGKPVNDSSTSEYTPGNTFHWSAAFVSVIMKEAGFPGYTGGGGEVYEGTANSVSKEEALAPWSNSVGPFVDWAREKGAIHDDDGQYIPRPGDLIIYDKGPNPDGTFDSIGFVYSADASGYKTIEGDTDGPNDSDDGGWKGVVNSHVKKYNDSTDDIKFISIPYPSTNNIENKIAKYAVRAVGGGKTTVDKMGRIGKGMWSRGDARELLDRIRKAHPSDYEALIAENSAGQDFKNFMDNNVNYTTNLSPIIKKMLAFGQSESIQDKFLEENIAKISDKAEDTYKNNWQKLDAKSKVYIVLQQVIHNSFQEKGWLTSSGTRNIINSVVEKQGDFNTLVADMKSHVEAIPTRKQEEFFSYSNVDYFAGLMGESTGGANTFKSVFKDVGYLVNRAASQVNGIPDKDLMFGLGSGKVTNLPDGLGNVKTYMGNHMITARSSYQYKLKQFTTTGEHGLGMIDGRITIAMYVGGRGSPKGYGELGDMIDIQLSTGQILHCVVADAKALEYDRTAGDLTDLRYGVHHDGSIVEFVLNTQVAGRYPDVAPNFTSIFPGYVKTVVNLGPINK